MHALILSKVSKRPGSCLTTLRRGDRKSQAGGGSRSKRGGSRRRRKGRDTAPGSLHDLAPSDSVEESTEADESEFDSGSDQEGSPDEQLEEVQPFDWATASYVLSATPAKKSTFSGGPKEPIVVDLTSVSEDGEDDETAVQIATNQGDQEQEDWDVSFATDSEQDEDVFPRRDSGSMEIWEDERSPSRLRRRLRLRRQSLIGSLPRMSRMPNPPKKST